MDSVYGRLELNTSSVIMLQQYFELRQMKGGDATLDYAGLVIALLKLDECQFGKSSFLSCNV